jgi:hypothetical protein
MKFLITLLSAAALFTSGISAAPFDKRGTIEARVATEYNIDSVMIEWMKDPKTQRRMNNACRTVGGWEGWAQLEIEDEMRTKFGIPDNTDIREQSVFEGQQKADFVLPKTAKLGGMIIELKCENKVSQSGGAIQTPVGKDITKRYNVKAAYQGYRFVALAMAYTPEAEEALAKVGMRPIPRAVAKVSGGTMKAYKETMTLGSLSKDMLDLSDAFTKLSVSRPASPTRPKTPPTTPGRPKTPPSTGTGSKPAPGAPKKPAAGKKPGSP